MSSSQLLPPEEVEKMAATFAMEFLTGHYRPLRDDEQKRFDQLRVVMLAFAACIRRPVDGGHQPPSGVREDPGAPRTSAVPHATKDSSSDRSLVDAPHAPESDNHHNALTCPYCNPNGLKFETSASLAPSSDLRAAVKGLIEWAASDERETFSHRYKDDGVIYTPYRVMAAKLRDMLAALDPGDPR